MDELPEQDKAFLDEKGYQYSLTRSESGWHLVISNFNFPEAYDQPSADVLINIVAGYPDAKLDMFYTIPDVKLKNGNWPQNCNQRAMFNGISWQQWSRHILWRPGIDNLRTFIASIIREIAKGI